MTDPDRIYVSSAGYCGACNSPYIYSEPDFFDPEPCEDGVKPIEYIRADLVAQKNNELRERIDELEAERDDYGDQLVDAIGREDRRSGLESIYYIEVQKNRELQREIARLKALQDSLRESLYRAGVSAGWNLGVENDRKGLARMLEYEGHLAAIPR